MHLFLEGMGYNALHIDVAMRDSYAAGGPLVWNNVLVYDAFGDVPFPIPSVAGACLRRFPEAKFVFCKRPVEDWLISIEALWHLNSQQGGNWHDLDANNPNTKINIDLYGSARFDRYTWGTTYTRRCSQIADQFLGNSERLCIVDLADDNESITGQLSAFLGRYAATVFPHTNRRSVGAHRIW